VEFFSYSSLATIALPDSGEEIHPPMLWIIKVDAGIALMSHCSVMVDVFDLPG
jgi:hypothetical protein